MNSYMRTLCLLIVFLLSASLGYLAAQSMEAAAIIAQINAGTDVNLSNTTIEGDLDFTKLDNMRETNTGGNRKSYRSTVKPNLTFAGCTFNGQVLGFINNEEGWGKSAEPIYHADFDGGVAFTDCVFKQEVAFKYSEFSEDANFRGSAFKRRANFKYTEFEEAASFTGCRFGGEADFKYTDFGEAPDFSRVVFQREADFKYTKLNAGVSFADTVFEDDADFKYTELNRSVSFAGANFRGEADFKYIKFPAGTNLTNTSFGRNTDFKYATLGGKKFSR